MDDDIERGELLLLAVSRMHRLQVELLGHLEITLTLRQYRILQRISAGYTSLSELSRLSHRSLPTISESVDGLIRRKLLSRKPSPTDRRAVLLSLTPTGRKALTLGGACLSQLAEDFFAELPASKHASLAQLGAHMHGYAGRLMWRVP
jgi:DNA-binding MarR family transcriptional regulator